MWLEAHIHPFGMMERGCFTTKAQYLLIRILLCQLKQQSRHSSSVLSFCLAQSNGCHSSIWFQLKFFSVHFWAFSQLGSSEASLICWPEYCTTWKNYSSHWLTSSRTSSLFTAAVYKPVSLSPCKDHHNDNSAHEEEPRSLWLTTEFINFQLVSHQEMNATGILKLAVYGFKWRSSPSPKGVGEQCIGIFPHICTVNALHQKIFATLTEEVALTVFTYCPVLRLNMKKAGLEDLLFDSILLCLTMTHAKG